MITESKIRDFLASIQPFKIIPREELVRHAREATAHQYTSGDNVYREGEPARSVWIVQHGRVVIYKESPVQGRYPIETVGPGELFGTLCRLGEDRGVYPCTATAAANTTVIRLPDRLFFSLYGSNAGFARQACGLCALRLDQTLNLRNIDQAPAATRIAQTLLRLHRVYGATIPMTKRELAELVGTALETTFRQLTKLQSAGVIRSERGRIVVKKAHLLQGHVA